MTLDLDRLEARLHASRRITALALSKVEVLALIAAIRAVDALHQPAREHEVEWCSECSQNWPCRTRRARGEVAR